MPKKCLDATLKFVFKTTHNFSFGLRNIINQPLPSAFNRTFLLFLISFCSSLSISSIGTIIGLKNSSSISLLFFSSLSFNSPSFNLTKSFYNSKICFFAHCLSILSQYFRFYKLYVLSFPSLYVL